MNVTGSGCRAKAHRGDAAYRMAIYDSLPREVRDRLKIARYSTCPGCVRNFLDRHGVEATLRHLDVSRQFEPVREGREVVYYRREDLRP